MIRPVTATIVIALVIVAAATGQALAQNGVQSGVMTRAEALELAYPGAVVTRDRVILTPEQISAVAAIARVGMHGRIFPRYIARNGDEVVGRAYIDTHTAKTERQSLLITLDTEGRIRRVDVTVFFEPVQYMAPSEFLRQFDGQVLHDALWIRLAIRPIAGASFTGRAISDAVRRVLALDQVLEGYGGASQ